MISWLVKLLQRLHWHQALVKYMMHCCSAVMPEASPGISPPGYIIVTKLRSHFSCLWAWQEHDQAVQGLSRWRPEHTATLRFLGLRMSNYNSIDCCLTLWYFSFNAELLLLPKITERSVDEKSEILMSEMHMLILHFCAVIYKHNCLSGCRTVAHRE